MKLRLLHIIILWALQIFQFSAALAQESNQQIIAIIVHESIETRTIDIDDLLDIYTLSKQRWDNNDRIRVADYKGSPAIRDYFYNRLNTNSNNIKRIWLRAQFTGRTTPPIIVNTANEMVETVVENPGTIGYVPLNIVPENVQILLEILY